ncbi:hypothetical protein F2Q68_00044225 [Brassica cretica]|uniref:Uncharacterized protein n=1 Tax=Brassica cretica TaxID=69181 RepID=A0A8S9LLR2_BRACR|nr:hypothetical protein F2Q68_00044225 [Brassica cretica]
MQKHSNGFAGIRRDGEMSEEISRCWREKGWGERRSLRREDGFLLIVKGFSAIGAISGMIPAEDECLVTCQCNPVCFSAILRA